MKTLLALFVWFAMCLFASAGQIEPPDRLIEVWARTMNNRRETPVLDGVDYAMIAKQDPKWTKDAVNKLFASIDPEKIKFADHQPEDRVVTMSQPFEVRFRFEVSHSKANPKVKYAVTTFYRLVAIERIQKKEAQQAAPSDGEKPSN